ncbi:hypothetical protein FH972_015662 [Carpinus fangiana]|uniref:Uncharacterized protein n=1 Tax=Carpinus fangiana TaxID=176857 RepID=A0A5N6RGW5_9ROSI|nr:hypothetical protein FH972_015662 [Carpinus fangiana]
MGEVLFELEQVLRSRQEKITPQEARVFLTCKSKAVRNFTFGSLAGAGVTWAATWRLRKISRINLSAGAAALFGLWRFARSLDSCVDHVLALNGSRMQKELANILVTKYQDDPQKMQLISKHFYSEKVFDDSDQPKLRWRYRNFFSDNAAHGQRTHEGDSPSNSENNSYGNYPGDSHKDSQTDAHSKVHGNSHNDSDSQRTNFKSKQILRNPGFDMMADPFDCLFGNLATREEIHLPNTSSTPPRTLTRGHKRSHRRRRMHHQNV